MDLNLNYELVKKDLEIYDQTNSVEKLSILCLDNIKLAALHILKAYYFDSKSIDLSMIDVSKTRISICQYND